MKHFIKDHKKRCVPPPQSIYLIFGQKELFLSDIGYFGRQQQHARKNTFTKDIKTFYDK